MNVKTKTVLLYIFLIIIGIIMIYPFIWLIFASFKTNEEIFGSAALLPKHFILDSFAKGWQGNGQYTYTRFFINTFELVIPTVLFTVASCSFVAYGFARFEFPFQNIIFTVMISTLLLPNAVIIVPRYILFKNFHWLNSYLPFIVPAFFACYPFFIFLVIQFLRGVPMELDEAAYIDGCNSFAIFTRVLLPLSKPALFSVAIFQFVWTWNDFLNPLIYINSVIKYPLALALKMSLDISSTVSWNQVLAMSVVSILPCVLLFFFAQKYFVEGIATTGLKG